MQKQKLPMKFASGTNKKEKMYELKNKKIQFSPMKSLFM